MGNEHRVIIVKLIQWIRDLALQGQTDNVWFEGRSDKYMYDAVEDIYWQTIGQFLLVYTESLEDDSYSYRLYRCLGEAWYDRKTVMNSAHENDDYRCLFRYLESGEDKTTPYIFDSGQWYEEFENVITNYINEY